MLVKLETKKQTDEIEIGAYMCRYDGRIAYVTQIRERDLVYLATENSKVFIGYMTKDEFLSYHIRLNRGNADEQVKETLKRDASLQLLRFRQEEIRLDHLNNHLSDVGWGKISEYETNALS